jgi:acetyltransferase-like isoleucine patch superfamily enzyme
MSSNSALIDRLEHVFSRKAELLRGKIVHWRGGKVGRNFGVGRSTRILYPCGIAAGNDVTIGDCSYINCQSAGGVRIGHNCSFGRNMWLHCGESGFFTMGNHSYIGCNAIIGAGGGGIQIGSDVLIGQGVSIHSENHKFQQADELIRLQGITYKGVVIGDDVWVGSKAVILDGVTIGSGVVIGAGAVVSRSIPPYSVAVGVPARVTGTRARRPLNTHSSGVALRHPG